MTTAANIVRREFREPDGTPGARRRQPVSERQRRVLGRHAVDNGVLLIVSR